MVLTREKQLRKDAVDMFKREIFSCSYFNSVFCYPLKKDKQSLGGYLQKGCCKSFFEIHRKTTVPEYPSAR